MISFYAWAVGVFFGVLFFAGFLPQLESRLPIGPALDGTAVAPRSDRRLSVDSVSEVGVMLGEINAFVDHLTETLREVGDASRSSEGLAHDLERHATSRQSHSDESVEEMGQGADEITSVAQKSREIAGNVDQDMNAAAAAMEQLAASARGFTRKRRFSRRSRRGPPR